MGVGVAPNCVTSGGKYPKLGVEGLLTLDPDRILDGSAGAYAEDPIDIARSIEGLGTLRATKGGKIHRLPGTSALRPGPRIGEGVEEVAKLVHPAAFGVAP